MNICQVWLFARNEYLPGINVCQVWIFARYEYFPGMNIFQVWIFARYEYLPTSIFTVVFVTGQQPGPEQVTGMTSSGSAVQCAQGKAIFVLQHLVFRKLDGKTIFVVNPWQCNSTTIITRQNSPIYYTPIYIAVTFPQVMQVWLEAQFLAVWAWRRCKDILTKGRLNESINQSFNQWQRCL